VIKEGNIPTTWATARLKDVFIFRGGGTPDKKNPTNWNGLIPWASVKDIKGMHLRATQDSITEAGFNSSATTLAKIGDLIIVTRISPGVTTIPLVEVSINQDLKVTTPPAGMSPEFCHYLFKTIFREIIEKSSGTTVLGIRLKELGEIVISLPPLKEQRRIVAKIEELFSELDAGIDNFKRARGSS